MRRYEEFPLPILKLMLKDSEAFVKTNMPVLDKLQREVKRAQKTGAAIKQEIKERKKCSTRAG